MCEINKAFLDKGIAERKSFVFTSDPKVILKTTEQSFSKDEVTHLMSKGYEFVQEGGLWRGVKK